MGWQRRMGAVVSPFGATGEASNGDPVQVEMYIGGSWVDVTSYVMVRDENGNITITRGRRDEGSTTEQASCTLLLNNRDGRWSPRNPSGVYYGLIGRNTPVRVSVPDGLGGKSYRFQGEIAFWPQGWDPTGTDVYTDIEASGILRRLSQGPVPPYSLMRTAIGTYPSTSLIAYWPMEDAEGSTTLASALSTGSPMTWTGNPTLAGYDNFPGSDPVVSTVSTVLTGGVPVYDDPTATQVRFLCQIPSDGLVNGTVVCSIQQFDYSSGSAQRFDLYYGNFGGTGHGFTLHTMAGDGTDLGADLENSYDVRGKRLYVSIELAESGTSITRAVRLYDLDTQASNDVSDTETLTQLSRVLQLQFGVASNSAASPHGTTGLSTVALGQVTLENAITPITALGVRVNPIGEAAGTRIARVCSDNTIAFESIGDLTDTVLMGAQTKMSLLDTVQEAELADGGMLYESMPNLGLGYRTRASLQNQDPQLTLNYTGFNLSEVPTPVEDDRYIQNQVTVTVGSVSQTYSATTGTLNVSQPPAGVGVYGTEVTLNLQSTGDALSQAAWRVHLGTVDEPRFPEISVNLAHSTFVNNPALKQAVLGLRQGDRILVQNPPFWLPPGNIDQIIIGFSETITHFEHRLTFVCAPASPYRVGVLDTVYGVIDTDGSQLVAAMGTSDTTVDVQPTAPATGLWTTDPNDMPVDVRVGGEVMTVTAINPAVYDTFTRVSASGWGTADSGDVWSNSGGSATDHTTNGTVAQQSTSFVSTPGHHDTVTSPAADVDLKADFASAALATGGSQYIGLMARMLDTNNFYYAQLAFTTTQAIQLNLLKKVASSDTTLASATATELTHAASTFFTLRLQVIGSTVQAKVWAQGTVEPGTWHVSATDVALVQAGSIGVRSYLDAANSNTLPFTFSIDNFSLLNPQTFTVTRSVNGIVKAQTAGTDVRLAYPTITSL
jgi:hypothetical protein